MEVLSQVSFEPLMILLLGTLCIIFLIVVLRIHAFLALMLSGILVGVLSSWFTETNPFTYSVELVMNEFGVMSGKIAFVIALASVLGVAMTESGAADAIVNRLIRVFGVQRAALALLISGFILSIPVFFDTVFFLLIPLARSLANKTNKNYLLYVLAVGCGGVITHSIVPPTPGPLVVAETLMLNMGMVISAGILMGIIPALAGYVFSIKLNSLIKIDSKIYLTDHQDAQVSNDLPGFGISMMPVVIPLLLIIGSSLAGLLPVEGSGTRVIIEFFGNKNIAMLIGMIIAIWIWAVQKNLNVNELQKNLEKPLEVAGLIILITGAGGAFGAMIRHSGIGEFIQGVSASGFELNLILVSFFISALLKIAQGSSTVAIITVAGIMSSIIYPEPGALTLEYHPIYIFLAIGFGSMVGSWMNDSGFWVVGKLSGFTENQTLQVWTTTLAVLGITGLIEVLIFSHFFPLI